MAQRAAPHMQAALLAMNGSLSPSPLPKGEENVESRLALTCTVTYA